MLEASQVTSYQVVTSKQAEHGLELIGPVELHYCTSSFRAFLQILRNDIHHDRTNITEPIKAYHSSRGSLTSSFLLSDSFLPLEGEVGKIIPHDSKFAGFNLLLLAPVHPCTGGPLHFDSYLVTNHGSGGAITSRPLSAREKSCGCVSNAVDAVNAEWPKVQHATKEFDAILQTLSPDITEAELTDQLFDMLAWVTTVVRYIFHEISDINSSKQVGDLLNLSLSVYNCAKQYLFPRFRSLWKVYPTWVAIYTGHVCRQSF